MKELTTTTAQASAHYIPTGDAGNISIQEAAIAWLETKHGRTGSDKTFKAYRDTLAKFDMYLQDHACALNGEPRTIARHAQGWTVTSVSGKRPSTSTINQRFAILSSFYQFAMKQGAYDVNPIEYAERPPRIVEDAAPYLEKEYVNVHMRAVDASTLEGKRNRALISLALTTGRRASELANITWQDITRTGDQMSAKWRCKGAKIMRDDLQPKTINYLLAYLRAQYGAKLERIQPGSPLFVSYSNNNRGGKLSVQAISNICKEVLEVQKVHTTRHTFAVNMAEAGASLSEIGDRLGHSNYKVTADYMKRLESSKNKYGRKLEELYGF